MTKIIVLLLAATVGIMFFVSMIGSDEDQQPLATEQEATASPPAPTLGLVDDARILAARENEPGSWLAYGMDFNERRFSPLTQINRENVGELGLAWHKDLGTLHAQEATPLVVDGLIIFPSAWNIVHAIDAKSGETRWVYDPKVDRARIGTIWAPFSRGIAEPRGSK